MGVLVNYGRSALWIDPWHALIIMRIIDFHLRFALVYRGFN